MCEQPVTVSEGLVIPRCLEMITADDVIRRIEMYLAGDQPTRHSRASNKNMSTIPVPSPNVVSQSPPLLKVNVLRIEGGLEQLLPAAVIWNHIRRYHPDWKTEVDHASHASEFAEILGMSAANGGQRRPLGLTDYWHLNGAATSAQGSPHWPNLAVSDWLLNTLRVSPIDDLYRVRFTIPEAAQVTVDQFMKQRGDSKDRPLVLLDSIEVDGSAAWKNAIRDINPRARVGRLHWPANEVQFPTLLLETDDNGESEFKVASFAEILAIVNLASVFIAIETPCVALAAGLNTPTIAVWRKAHPAQCVPPTPRMEHLLIDGAIQLPLSPPAIRYFKAKYRFRRVSDECTGVLESLATLLRDTPSPTHSLPTAVRDTSEPIVNRELPATLKPSKPRRSPSTQHHSVRFFHGLGDAANFARLIPLYTRRGYRIGVECTPDKEILFRAAGAEIVEQAHATHDWAYPPQDVHSGHDRPHQGSKVGWNISEPPLPDIGNKAELWEEYCQSEVRVAPLIPEVDREFIRRWLHDLPRPIVLMHTIGNTNQSIKSLPDPVTRQFYREFLDRCDGTIVALDWDNRVPRIATYRFRHLNDIGGGCSTSRMFALMDAADLMIGVDSGPLHAAGLTDTPRVGLWMPGHYAARYSLPHPKQLNLVLARPTEQWNRYRRVPWNIIDQPGVNWDAAWIAEQCARMVHTPRYLDHSQIAVDVQLQHWVGNLCRGNRNDPNAAYTDRNRSFDILLRAASSRFDSPTFVETGTIRSEEDWAGTGFSTYLFGNYLRCRGGKLHSVDLSPQHCEFARTWTQVYGDVVNIHREDSISFLTEFSRPIDVLYLDSLDTTEPGHAEHALREARVALQRLHEQSLILIDDTYWQSGAFCGKGAQAVPWLLNHGWDVMFAGYQVLLCRRQR